MSTTPARRFVGQNIKGTPAMSAAKVRHDLRQVRAHADVAVLQEFKWRWYWVGLRATLAAWGTYPGKVRGIGSPIRGGQPVLWKRDLWRRLDHRARLLHDGHAGWSDDRLLRAELLADATLAALACWFAGTHFVVNGDKATDPAIGRQMMATDQAHLDAFLTDLQATGWPIILELDANIAVGSAAWGPFLQIIEAHHGQFVGTKGVEYLVVFQGTKAQVEILESWTIPTSQLYTDHEGRGLTFRIVSLPPR